MGLPLIKVVQLTVTNRCQCNCMHCGVSKLRQAMREELSFDQIDALLQDLRLAGCQVVDLFGGEPTLRRDLCDIIVRARSYGFFVSLETNGYAIDEAYMDRLTASGLDQIYLSLDDYRSEGHDAIRRKAGAFDHAVKALDLGAKSGIIMHVSTVPQSPDFFYSGDINRFMEFVLGHGAQMVRLLLPRFVGDSIRADGRPLAAGEEKDLFSRVLPQYRDYMYLHTPGTPLGEKNICTAKQVFCHIMANGSVAPCPYFPLVFGDATREPIVDVFERIQSHPLVRMGGDYCPMRNEDYINEHIRQLGLDRPFFPITVENQIDLGSPCGGGCSGCAYGARSDARSADEIVRDIAAVHPEYTRIELYGGDAALRDDLPAILDRVPEGKKIVLWSSSDGTGQKSGFWQGLRSRQIEAIKLHLSTDAQRAEPGDASGLREALRNVALVCSTGLPIHLYVPMDAAARFQDLLSSSVDRLGMERLYAFTKDFKKPLTNAVACFGRGMGSARILWAKNEKGEQTGRSC